jgi:hypothetical protein
LEDRAGFALALGAIEPRSFGNINPTAPKMSASTEFFNKQRAKAAPDG